MREQTEDSTGVQDFPNRDLGPAGVSCPVCGQPAPAGARCANRWCRRDDRAFSCVFAVGSYQGRLRAAILDYKYRGARWRADGFARLLAGYLDAHPTWFEEFDSVVAVPGFTGEGARRDWDPVRLIVDRLAVVEDGQWQVMPGAVIKTKETVPMSGRSRAERERVGCGELRRALAVPDPAAVAGCRVLAVDDVLTEGSTLQEVARALLTAGASEVAGLVVARPAWKGLAQPAPA